MDVPLSIILDVLSKYPIENHIPESDKRVYKGVSMMPNPPIELVASLIHVSLLSVAVQAGGLENGQSCVCLRDRDRDALETEEVLRGLIIIESEFPMEYIFHEIHSVFIVLSDWERAMLDCIIHKDLATLVALGENITGHQIFVMDSSLALLAHTSGSAEQLWEKLLPLGSSYDIRALFGTGRSEGAHNKPTVHIVNDLLLSEHPLAVGTMAINTSYAVYVIAECAKRPVNSTLIALIEIFTAYVESFVKNRLGSPAECVRVYDRLVNDLIEGKVTNPKIIKSRCEFSGLKDTAPYTLLRIEFKRPGRISYSQVMDELSVVLPEIKPMLFKGHVLAIHYSKNGDCRPHTRDCEGLPEFLHRYGAVCGVSGLMYNIASIKTAYEQTEFAVDYGRRVRKNKLLSDEDQAELSISVQRDVYRYEDYDVYRIIDGGSQQKEIPYSNSNCLCALSKLWLNDKSSRLNNLKLLYIYLLTERQGTLTARILHMHRNNVYYHITRIEELLGIDLNDPTLRTKLLMTYKILDLYGEDYLSTSDYYNSLDTEILRELCALNKTKSIKKTLGAL